MGSFIMHKNLSLILLAFILLSCASSQTKHSNDENKIESYYRAEDFAAVNKFDVHIHINTGETAFIEQARKDNFRFLDIVDDRPFGLPMAAQQEFAIQHLRNFPNDMAFATTFPVHDWKNPDWAETTISSLKQSIANGAKAVKIWKNIGMDLREEDGTFVMVDNPKLKPVLDYLEKNRIPLIGHNGEPRDCWLPLDSMTFSKGYYGSHPEYHMYLHPEYPSYDDQINARDNMLKMHPKLRFVGAHLGSLEWSLDELAKRFERYPNMKVDLSRMSNLKLHALNDRDKTRDFFIKYQDRLVYGSDRQVNPTSDKVAFTKGIHDGWMKDWEFFVTDNTISLTGFGDLKGLKLPKEVVDKIYSKNVERWLSPL
ncbi:MAG: amidohydrolase family protein [Daejeonella sp.]|uniref:amidohydrolase family protein n=1 Tax=Daejeonella sp. TaxID=2805397 RepID=UPI003C783EA0